MGHRPRLTLGGGRFTHQGREEVGIVATATDREVRPTAQDVAEARQYARQHAHGVGFRLRGDGLDDLPGQTVQGVGVERGPRINRTDDTSDRGLNVRPGRERSNSRG